MNFDAMIRLSCKTSSRLFRSHGNVRHHKINMEPTASDRSTAVSQIFRRDAMSDHGRAQHRGAQGHHESLAQLHKLCGNYHPRENFLRQPSSTRPLCASNQSNSSTATHQFQPHSQAPMQVCVYVATTPQSTSSRDGEVGW
jgi:hypothetical protein